MSARIVEIADAVVTLINAASLGLPSPATRRWLFERRLEQLDELHVDVVPATATRANLSRAETSQEVTIQVVVQKSITPVNGGIDDAAVDAVVTTAEAIANAVERQDAAGASYQGSTHDPVAEPSILAELSAVRSVLTFTYLAT